MITITFDQFINGDFAEDHYQLYVIRNADQALYVGISQRGVRSRWFGQRGHMGKNAGGYWYSTDAIGQEIVEKMPASLSWTIELWTLEDCKNFFAVDVINRGWHADRCDITDYEPMMITKLSPAFNGTYNS